MYEAEVKFYLIKSRFSPHDGWRVTVHLDPMELCRGGKHPEGKSDSADHALKGLQELGVEIGIERSFRVDIRAEHPVLGTYLIEAKGEGRQQKEQGFYSAVGQLVTKVGDNPDSLIPALAFPDEPTWHRQANKLPTWLREKLGLVVSMVSRSGARLWPPEAA